MRRSVRRGQLLLSFLRPTFDALLPPSLRALLGAESVAAAELSAAAVSAAAELSAEAVSAAAELSAEAVSAAPEPEALALVSAAAELSAEAVSVHCEVDNSEHRKIFVLTNIG